MKGKTMPLRKMKLKKFKGIYEYYKASDHDKTTIAYYISVRDAEGKPKKIKTSATTAEEAVTALAHYKATRKTTPVAQNHRLTLSDLAEKFFNERTTSNNAKEQRMFKLHIQPVLGSKLISKVTTGDIKRLQKHLEKKQVPSSIKKDAPLMLMSNKSINNITDIASMIMNWAQDPDQGYLPDQKREIKKLPVDNERSRTFSEKEINLIFDSTESDTRIFIMLMYYTAQRPESILRLQKKHIVNGSIHISSIKKQSSHKVPISDKLEQILSPWIKDLKANDFIITKSKKRMPYQTMSGRVSKLFKEKFNKDLNYKQDSKQWASLYTLRHTALTNIYENTEDIYAAQSIANHSSVQMTQRYAKKSEQLKRNAVKGL